MHDPIVQEYLRMDQKCYLPISKYSKFNFTNNGQNDQRNHQWWSAAGWLFVFDGKWNKKYDKQKQLAIVVRYVDKEGMINERFLTFIQAISLNARAYPNT